MTKDIITHSRFCMHLANGFGALLWKEVLIEDVALIERFPRLFLHEIKKDCQVN